MLRFAIFHFTSTWESTKKGNLWDKIRTPPAYGRSNWWCRYGEYSAVKPLRKKRKSSVYFRVINNQDSGYSYHTYNQSYATHQWCRKIVRKRRLATHTTTHPHVPCTTVQSRITTAQAQLTAPEPPTHPPNHPPCTCSAAVREYVNAGVVAKTIVLTGSASREELNRSETLQPTHCNSYRRMTRILNRHSQEDQNETTTATDTLNVLYIKDCAVILPIRDMPQSTFGRVMQKSGISAPFGPKTGVY